METCQPAEGLHRIPKGSEVCLCGRTSRTFPDPRAFDAWKRLWDSAAAKSPLSESTPPVATATPVETAPAQAEPATSAPAAQVPAEPPPAAEPPKPAPKKGKSKALPPAPAAP